MNRWKVVMTVVAWEFRRFFKIRDLLIGIGIGVAAAVFFGLMQAWVTTTRPTVVVAVVGMPASELQDAYESARRNAEGALAELPGAQFRFIEIKERDPVELIRTGQISGLLSVEPASDAQLTVMREPLWAASLHSLLSGIRREREVSRLGVSREQLAEALRPVTLEITTLEDERDRLEERMIIALISIAFVVFATITAAAYMFTCITSEKQQRVTEQLIAAVGPQCWVDGKIIGLSLVAFASVLVYVAPVGIVIIALAGPALAGGFLGQPGNIGTMIQVLLMAVLGMFFWLAMLAAVAATINDPNTSFKNLFVFLPVLASGPALVALGNPKGLAVEVLSVFPLTSFAIMPMRLVLADVPLWQYLFSVMLLLASIWLMRWVAGRIFTVAVLMYGKEPSLNEVFRWLRGGPDAKAG